VKEKNEKFLENLIQVAVAGGSQFIEERIRKNIEVFLDGEAHYMVFLVGLLEGLFKIMN